MIRVAVVGYGYWGPNLARNISKAPGCKLAAVCDLSVRRLVQARRSLGPVRRDRGVHDDYYVPLCTSAVSLSAHRYLAANEAGHEGTRGGEP